jgi:hypothetical protein
MSYGVVQIGYTAGLGCRAKVKRGLGTEHNKLGSSCSEGGEESDSGCGYGGWRIEDKAYIGRDVGDEQLAVIARNSASVSIHG